MKMIFAFAGAMALLVSAQSAVAQSTGPYVSGALGLVLPRDSDLSGTAINSALESDMGFGVTGAVGNAFTENWRAEAEVSYRSADVDSIGGAAGSGSTALFGLMVNGYYDIPTNTAWTPYVGAGVGAARVWYDSVSPVGGSRIGEFDNVLAYQGIAGIGYKLNDNAGLFTEYRYVATADPKFTNDAGTRVSSETGEHRIMVGLRWSFGAPKPMPKATPVAAAAPTPAPPAPEPKKQEVPEVPRQYLVFFDWDRSDLTADARTILAKAVENSGKAGLTRIETTGHADRSGPDPYNLKLSKRRAESVRAELVRLGVSENGITVRWKGERAPLVATEDGVREPQNRRVEIILN